MEEGKIFESLMLMQQVVEGPVFSSWRKSFVQQHCDKFDYEDENKLEYTELHQQYEEGIEKLLTEGMPDNFEMADFMQSLPGYLESESGKREETGKIVTLLLEISDFRDFKEMMLFSKKQKEDALDPAIGVQNLGALDEAFNKKQELIQVEGMIDLCAQLSASEDDDGWQTVFRNDWMRVENKPVEEHKRASKNEVYMRGAMTMNLSYIEAVDLFLYYGDRRGHWDTNFKGCEAPFGGDIFEDDDIVVVSTIDFGTLMHMMGFPRKLTFKIIKRWDFPKNGQVSACIVPWDLQANSPNTKSTILTLKTLVIKPHATDPGKAVVTTLEMNRLGGMPKWALNLLMTVTAPGMMRGMEQRYIKKIRESKTEKTVDLTPGGRANRPKGAVIW